jgi:hypothetical protein
MISDFNQNTQIQFSDLKLNTHTHTQLQVSQKNTQVNQ